MKHINNKKDPKKKHSEEKSLGGLNMLNGNNTTLNSDVNQDT